MNSALDPDDIIGIALHLHVELDLWWGQSRLGLILCAAFFHDDPVTSEQIADVMGVSSETVRRYLKPLINVDRVCVIREGRNVRYLAHQDWAVKTRDIMLKARKRPQPCARTVELPKRLIPFELSDNMIIIGEGASEKMIPIHKLH